jgi:hypothetical protein
LIAHPNVREMAIRRMAASGGGSAGSTRPLAGSTAIGLFDRHDSLSGVQRALDGVCLRTHVKIDNALRPS